jgi:DNA gyrase subunit B
VIERESRVIDPMLQEAMLKVEALSLESEASARQTIAALNAHISAEDLALELMHDSKNDGWMIKITRKLHGNVMVSVLDQDFLNSSDYRELAKTSGMLRGLLGAGAFVRRGETVRPVSEFAQALDWLLADAKKGMAIQRYKGLGEMNAEQLWDTTMDPTVRRLLKVRIEDAIGADDVFTTLMGDDVEPRRAFIESNALIARNIDV